jgi:hypothetical protein
LLELRINLEDPSGKWRSGASSLVRPSTSFLHAEVMFVVINSQRDPIGHRPIRKDKGTVGEWDHLHRGRKPCISFSLR